MNLGQLLTQLREGILNDRTDRVSGTADYLWTDETLVLYINEAQRRFARLGLVLRDASTPEVTQVTLVAGQSIYQLHESVLGVISIKEATQQSDLRRIGHNALAQYRAPTDTWADPSTLYQLPPGAPLAYTTDEELSSDDDGSSAVVTLRVYPTPRAEDAGKVLHLRVVRTPIEDFDVNNKGAVPEIGRDHHLEMLDWAAYLALRIVDDDAGAAKRADVFAATFAANVKEARNSAMRKLFTPMPWGFGRGGWSWGSNYG